jgi:hypothetical protein
MAESPSEQGSALCTCLRTLCPKIAPATFPRYRASFNGVILFLVSYFRLLLCRPFAQNRPGLEKMCSDVQATELKELWGKFVNSRERCSICRIHSLDSEGDIMIRWSPEFERNVWRLQQVIPCCKQCASVGSLERILNRMLAVDDDESEFEFKQLADHFQSLNQTDNNGLQLALNLSNAIKTLSR